LEAVKNTFTYRLEQHFVPLGLESAQQSAGDAQGNAIETPGQPRFTVNTLKEYPRVSPSLIVWDVPDSFEDFGGKQFALLWCDSHDGFNGGEFHTRCNDGQTMGNNCRSGIVHAICVTVGRPESKIFRFHPQECAQCPGEEISVEVKSRRRQFVVLLNEIQRFLKFVLQITARQTPD
jgi:hypothetical protein